MTQFTNFNTDLTAKIDTTMESTFFRDARGVLVSVTTNPMEQFVNLDPISDPLELEVKPMVHLTLVKLEPWLNSDPKSEPETDPLDISMKIEPSCAPVAMKHEPSSTYRSPPRFLPFLSVPSQNVVEVKSELKCNVTDESPSICLNQDPSNMKLEYNSQDGRTVSESQDTVPELGAALLPGTSHEQHIPESNMKQEPECTATLTSAVSLLCHPDESNSESSCDNDSHHSTQPPVDSAVAAKYQLKQCSVPVSRCDERVSELSTNHRTPAVVDSSFRLQSYVSDSPSTSCGSKVLMKSRLVSIDKSEKKHIQKKFKCDVCSRLFGSLQALNNHLNLYPDPHVACTDCFRVFSTMQALLEHQSMRHVDENKCNVCDKVFASPQSLIGHKPTHSKSPPTCSLCNNGFVYCSFNHLRRHLKLHGKKKSKKFSCSKCKKSFPSKESHTVHLLKHTKSFKCTYCDSAFYQKSHLADHLSIHSNKREYKCDECDKCYNTSRALKQHKLMHKPPGFTCAFCNMTWSWKSSLKRHILALHTPSSDRIRFHCSVCTKYYLNTRDLKHHLKTHNKQ